MNRRWRCGGWWVVGGWWYDGCDGTTPWQLPPERTSEYSGAEKIFGSSCFSMSFGNLARNAATAEAESIRGPPMRRQSAAPAGECRAAVSAAPLEATSASHELAISSITMVGALNILLTGC